MLNSRSAIVLLVIVVLAVGFAGGYLYNTFMNMNKISTLTTTFVTSVIQIQTLLYTAPLSIVTTIVLRDTIKCPIIDLDLNGDSVIDLVAELNPWDLKNYKGIQQMIIDSQGRVFRSEINITNAYPLNRVNGYPEIYIGRKPWGSRYANGFGVEFPLKISNMSSFIVSFYICVESLDPSVIFNIAADAWIVRESIAFKPSTPPSNGDLEIMVWLYRQNLNPAGRKIGEETLPIVINGSKVNATFEVWREDSVSWGGWQYIAFAPKGWGLDAAP